MQSFSAIAASSPLAPLLLRKSSNSNNLSRSNKIVKSVPFARRIRVLSSPFSSSSEILLLLASSFPSSHCRQSCSSSAAASLSSSSSSTVLVLLASSFQTTLTSRRLRFYSPCASSGSAGLGGERRRKKTCCSRCTTMSVSGSQDSAPSGTSRKVTIVNHAGEKLAGIIDDTKSKELVVLCHGFRSSKDDNSLGGIAKAISKTGISTFRFDFAGNGESEGQFAYGNYWRETEDLRSVILHWRAEGRQVTAILGHSKGGNVVVLYASKYGDVSTVINVSGRFALDIGTEARFGKKGMKKLEEEGFLDVKNKAGVVEYQVTMQSLNDRLQTDMDAGARSISKDVRVLTIHGEVDEIVAVKNAHEFAKRIPNHELRIIDGGTHNYEGTQKELYTLVLQFLQGNLSKI